MALLGGVLLVFVAPATALGFVSQSRRPAVVLRGLPAQSATLPKLDSALRVLATQTPAPSLWLRERGLSVSTPPLRQGRVLVQVTASNVAQVRAAVARLGGRVEVVWRSFVFALVPTRSLAALSRLPAVDFVGSPQTSTEQGDLAGAAYPGEELGASGAPAWQASGITGRGVKVAIIDSGFVNLAAEEAAGYLPSNVVTADFCGGQFSVGEGHGTAVAEIVHSMAPDAQLYLACTNTGSDLSKAEQWAKQQGVKVINFSAAFIGDSRQDGSGFVASIPADARKSGILWVNSAGNYATQHWAGQFTDANQDGLHEWAGGNPIDQEVWPAGAALCGHLTWDEWPDARSDLGLALVDPATDKVIAAADDSQTGTQPPEEDLCTDTNTTGSNLTVGWVVFSHKVVGAPRLDLFTSASGIDSDLQYSVAAGSVADPATSASALAVGAVCWQSGALEPFSSQGPTIDGRVKPDIAGHDSVSGSIFGPYTGCFTGFSGTSAASPEVAGAAALVAQHNLSATPAQIEAVLTRSAVDAGPAGLDDQTGAGVLRLPAPDTTVPVVKALPASGQRGQVVKLAVSAFDNSGRVDVTDQVKQNGRVIKTLTLPGVSTPATQTVTFAWTAPKSVTGTITQCAQGEDQQLNPSPVSCARVTLAGSTSRPAGSGGTSRVAVTLTASSTAPATGGAVSLVARAPALPHGDRLLIEKLPAGKQTWSSVAECGSRKCSGKIKETRATTIRFRAVAVERKNGAKGKIVRTLARSGTVSVVWKAPPPPPPPPAATPGHYVGSTADHELWAFDIGAGGLSLANLQTGQINESCTPPDYYLSGGDITEPGPFTVNRDGSFSINLTESLQVGGDAGTDVIAITGRISGGIASGTYRVDTSFSDNGTAYSCTTGNQTWTATLATFDLMRLAAGGPASEALPARVRRRS
jgi:subtilisin family serine protease